MKKIKVNFFQKLLIYSVTLTFLGIAMVQLLNLTFLDRFYINRKKMEIPVLAQQIENFKGDAENLNQYIEDISEETGAQITLGNKNPYGQKGRNFSTNMGNRKNSIYEPSIAEEVVELKKTKSGGKYLSYTKNIKGIPLHIIFPLISMESYRYEATLIEIISMGIALILSFILGGFFSKRLTRNIEKLNDAAKKMAHLEFVEKLEINTEDEIGELAQSIEEMSQNLRDSMESLKNFVGNASHELKTPISVVNMICQNLRNEDMFTKKERLEAYEKLIKETEGMGELIQNLMTLSKVSYSKNNLNPININLKKIVMASVYKYEMLEIDKGLDVQVDIDRDVYLLTDYSFFKVVLDNLIQNAMKYAPLESALHIFIEENRLVIENELEKNLQEKKENLFEPFKRGSNVSGTDIEGSGLGLSIVKSILELLNFSYSLEIDGKIFKFI
ncbi:MAG: HAMP domain-containing sensor histidine kinase, partial [Fusobacteriaceae bacterium]